MADLPLFAALRSVQHQMMRPEDAWFDTYGNHEVWFGAPPFGGKTAGQHIQNCMANISLVPGLSQPWLRMWTPPLATAHLACSLQFVRINTITLSAFPVMALGRVLRHPPRVGLRASTPKRPSVTSANLDTQKYARR